MPLNIGVDQILVIRHHLVDQPFRGDLDDPVRRRLNELVVVRDEQNRAVKIDQPVVQCRNRFEIEMVRRLVEDEHVRSAQHHLRQHAAHSLASRQDVRFLQCFVAGEQHPAEKAAHEVFILVLRVLPHPVDQIQIDIIEIIRVVFGKIRLRRRNAPCVFAGVRLQFARDNLEQRRLRHPSGPTNAILSPLFTMKLTLSRIFTSSNGFGDVLTVSNCLPASRSDLKLMNGYLREEGRMSSSVSFSSCFLREVACFDFDALALKRWMNASSSLRFSSIFLLVSRVQLQRQLARLVPEVVVADVHLDFAEVDVGDVRAHLVQEVPVVGDDDDGAFEFGQKVFQPWIDSRSKWLVGSSSSKMLRIAEQRLREQHAHFLVAAQIFHLDVMQRFRNAESDQQLRRIGFGFPAVQFLEFPFQLGRLSSRLPRRNPVWHTMRPSLR